MNILQISVYLTVIPFVAAGALCVTDTPVQITSSNIMNITSCSTFTGSIVIQEGGNVALDGIEHIRGSLSAVGKSDLMFLGSNTLKSVDELELGSLDNLETIHFPYLKQAGVLKWYNLQKLSKFTTTSGVFETSELSIHGTALQSLDGIDLQTADSITISGNSRLETISLSRLENVTISFTLFDNSKLDGNITLHSLRTVGKSLDLSGKFSAISLPRLQRMNAQVNIQSTYDISSTCEKFNSLHGATALLTGRYQCGGLQKNPGSADQMPIFPSHTTSTAAKYIVLSSRASLVYIVMLGIIYHGL